MALIERDLTGDTVSVADAIVPATRYVRSLGADAVVVSDLFVRHPIFSRVLVDVVVVADSIRSSNPHVVLADAVAVADIISTQRFITHVRSASDAVVVTDLLAVVLSSFNVRLSDPVAVNDLIYVQFTFGYPHVFMYDDATVTDALVVGKSRNVVLSDTLVVTDSISRGFVKAVVLADTVVVTDVIVRSQVAVRTKPDSIGVSDFLDAAIPTLADRNPFNRAPGYV